MIKISIALLLLAIALCGCAEPNNAPNNIDEMIGNRYCQQLGDIVSCHIQYSIVKQ